ncbi:unnamed protein product, partial [Amoebophrya sp. A25]
RGRSVSRGSWRHIILARSVATHDSEASGTVVEAFSPVKQASVRRIEHILGHVASGGGAVRALTYAPVEENYPEELAGPVAASKDTSSSPGDGMPKDPSSGNFNTPHLESEV